MNSPDYPQLKSAPTAALLSANLQNETPAVTSAAGSVSRASGYGLPCAKCRTYYPAALTSCPVCKSTERVSPTIQEMIAASTFLEPTPDPEVLEQERERFLQKFSEQIAGGGLQINSSTSFHCSKEENHQGSFEPAAICQACYDRLQEKADQFEAALLIDVKDATQIIFDAVWADPS